MPVFCDGFTVYAGEAAWEKIEEFWPGFRESLTPEYQEKQRIAALPFNEYSAYIQNKCAARAEANRAELATFDRRLATARRTLTL